MNLMENQEQEFIGVWIKRRKNSKLRMWFCNICRTALFQYKGEIVSIVPGNPEAEGEDVTKFPFIIKCRGNSVTYGKCPVTWVIEGYVEELGTTPANLLY